MAALWAAGDSGPRECKYSLYSWNGFSHLLNHISHTATLQCAVSGLIKYWFLFIIKTWPCHGFIKVSDHSTFYMSGPTGYPLPMKYWNISDFLFMTAGIPQPTSLSFKKCWALQPIHVLAQLKHSGSALLLCRILKSFAMKFNFVQIIEI